MADRPPSPLDPDGREARPPDLHTQLEDLFNLIWREEKWEATTQHAVDEA